MRNEGRHEDWPERLIAEINRHAALPFEWGVSDCYLLPIDCAVAMTGYDPWPSVRGSYATRMAAGRRLRRRGWGSVADAFSAFYAEIPPNLAQRGDIGVVDDPGGQGLAGVVFANGGAIGKAERGIRPVRLSDVILAYRVE